ncbi:AraC family transcriptional regulator [Chitinophaga sp. Cy-1792]|uniref:helix-turn-helix domain-containing protein n=1 Tax=Chitinophaga sp. Cy-1792 TaxID=2608339 RepID=UPI0014219F95|nr:AraC family transcriptional regulator [Chitinophaga sp. Cy-1792]NIG55758.1 helix-turn-helix transcriptional regulator [Chitinophaga sp. Cy-1792]
MELLGVYIRDIREKAGYPASQFAGISHIPAPALLRMEHGLLLPTKYQLLQFAGQLSLSAKSLLTQQHAALINSGAGSRMAALKKSFRQWQSAGVVLECFPIPDYLRAVIESIVYFECSDNACQTEKILPDGHAQLILNLSSATATLIGQRDQPVDHPQESRMRRIIIRFQPDGLFSCTGIPQEQLLNQAFNAAAIFGEPVNILVDALQKTTDTKLHLPMLLQFFSGRMGASGKFPVEASVIRYMIENIGQPLALLVAKSGYSQKHLIHLFRMFVGVTPKVMQQIRLFFNSIQAVSMLPTSRLTGFNWSEAYADQAHFNRQFTRFSGFTPTAYLNTGCTCPRMVQL